MIIDIILDRKECENTYTPAAMRSLYDYAVFFKFDELARALDGGGDDDVKRELVDYLKGNGYYTPELAGYVKSRLWILPGY